MDGPKARRETPNSTSIVTEGERRHRERPSDRRFAKLASRPYATLTESERTSLVVEHAAHNEAAGSSTGEQVVGTVLIAGLLGAALAVVTVDYILSHAWHVH